MRIRQNFNFPGSTSQLKWIRNIFFLISFFSSLAMSLIFAFLFVFFSHIKIYFEHKGEREKKKISLKLSRRLMATWTQKIYRKQRKDIKRASSTSSFNAHHIDIAWDSTCDSLPGGPQLNQHTIYPMLSCARSRLWTVRVVCLSNTFSFALFSALRVKANTALRWFSPLSHLTLTLKQYRARFWCNIGSLKSNLMLWIAAYTRTMTWTCKNISLFLAAAEKKGASQWINGNFSLL